MSGKTYPDDPNVRTVLLGTFTPEHANEIAGHLEDAGISWWYKQPGFISSIWEGTSTRVFVDRERGEEAVAIVRQVLGTGEAGEG